MNDSKSVFASKIFWVNVVSAAVAILTALLGQDWIAEYPKVFAGLTTALTVVNVVLRLLTTVPVHIIALFLAFVLPLSVCQAACRHLPRHPIPDKYPKHGSVIVSPVATTRGNWWEVRERMMPQFGGFSWYSVSPCNPDDDELSHLPEPGALCLTHRAVATFDRKWCNYRIEDVEWPVPTLFDPATGRRLP